MVMDRVQNGACGGIMPWGLCGGNGAGFGKCGFREIKPGWRCALFGLRQKSIEGKGALERGAAVFKVGKSGLATNRVPKVTAPSKLNLTAVAVSSAPQPWLTHRVALYFSRANPDTHRNP